MQVWPDRRGFFLNGFWLWLEIMVEHLSQSMNNLFLKLDFTKAWKVDERNQNIRLKNLHVLWSDFFFLWYLLGNSKNLIFPYSLYKFLFEIIFFQKFIQNVIPRMLQVVQELIPVDEVTKLFLAHTVLNLGFLLIIRYWLQFQIGYF